MPLSGLLGLPPWLIHRTKVTRGAAAGYLAWVRRFAAHPRVAAALADGVMSESYGRKVCEWTGKLPPDCQDAAEAILVAAAAAGAHLADLAALAAEMYARSLPGDEDDPGQSFDDRRVTEAMRRLVASGSFCVRIIIRW